jgi:antitoxin MazE6
MQGTKAICRLAQKTGAGHLLVSLNRLLASRRGNGYTNGMKTAVSVPDEVYRGAERLARRVKKSRSRLYSEALQEYLARHAPDEVTEAMNRACAEIGQTADPFVSSAARRLLERSEW